MSDNKKSLFINIFLLVLVNFLIKPFWAFGVDIKVMDIVDTETYGFYYAVFNFTSLFQILTDLGVNQFNNRDIARNPNNFQKQFAQLFTLKMFFNVVYIVVTLLIAYLYYGYESERFDFLIILCINQIFFSLILYNRSNFTALFKFKTDIFFSVFDKLISIGIFIYIFYVSSIKDNLVEEFNIDYYVYAQTVGLFISFIVSLIVLLKIRKTEWTKLSFAYFLPYLKKTILFATAVLLMTLYTRIDAVMIEAILPGDIGKYQTGVYAAGYKLLDALNQIPYLFSMFLIPVFAKQLKDKEDFRPVFSASLRILLTVSIGVTIVVFFWGDAILQLLYQNNYREDWGSSFLYLIFSFNTAILIYITGSLLTADNKMLEITIMSVVALVINIALNYFLIKKDGAAGASLATLITQGSMAIMQTFLMLKLWKFKFSLEFLLKFIIYIVALSVASYYLQSELIYIGVVIVIALVLALAFNLLDWRMFLQKND